MILLTAPFLWLRLAPDFRDGTVMVTGALQRGARLVWGLWPMVALVFCVGMFFLAARSLKKKYQESIFKYSRQHRYTIFWIGFFVLLVFGFLGGAKFLNLAAFLGIYMILALGLNIAVGMAGLLVLGYAGFYLFGAYVFAIAQKYFGWCTWWMALIPIFLLGAAVGWIVGLPCLKLRGDYLAIVTLGFAEGIRELVRNITPISGGDRGMSLSAHSQFTAWGSLTTQQWGYFIILLGVAAAAGTIYRIYHSKVGRAWVAIREDELAAEAMGVPVVKMKLWAFALSAGFAAVAGVFYAAYVGFIDPVMGAFEQSILVLAMVILGGMGSVAGALMGSALIFLIPSLMRDYVPELMDYRLFCFGAIVVAMMLYRPQGLMGTRRREHEIKEAS